MAKKKAEKTSSSTSASLSTEIIAKVLRGATEQELRNELYRRECEAVDAHNRELAAKFDFVLANIDLLLNKFFTKHDGDCTDDKPRPYDAGVRHGIGRPDCQRCCLLGIRAAGWNSEVELIMDVAFAKPLELP